MKFLFAPDLQLASDDRSEGIHHAVGIWKGVDIRVCTGLGDDLSRSNPPTWQRVQNKDFSSASDMLELFQSLGRGEADSCVLPSPADRNISLDKRLEMYAGNGDEPLGFMFTRTS